MGQRRAGHAALGHPSVKAALLLLPLLGGCAVIPDIAGLAAGGAAGGVTANPVVGYAVGISVRVGVDELQLYIARNRARGEQDAIADAAGTTPLDTIQPWEIRHTIPIGNEAGTLVPIRTIATPLATCREVLFTVRGSGTFTTSVCHASEGWRWAGAEPAVARWGYLQSRY